MKKERIQTMDFLTTAFVDEYEEKMRKIVGLRPQVEKVIDEVMTPDKKNLFLVGIGGTLAVMLPFMHMFKKMSDAPVYAENAAELLATGNRHLGKDSVVFFMSDSGNTKEIIAAIELCKEIGATTICGIGNENSAIEKLVDYSVLYLHKDPFSADADYILQYLFFAYYLEKRGEFPDYPKFVENLERLPGAMTEVKRKADVQGREFAKKYHKEDYHIFTAGGNTWGEVYCYAMCVLEEMQWIRTKSVTASDFFHGTLELVDEDMHVVIIKGEDESRVVTDRIEDFCSRYSKKVTVYDTKAYDLEGIDKEYRSMLSPLVVCAALGRINPHMEYATGHSLSFRRYYKVVEY
jgi:fructoselysine-6-phosphate deglycase